jgi:hypothetical protein
MHFFDKTRLYKTHYIYLIFTKIDLVRNFEIPNNIKHLYEDYVLPQNVFLVSSKKNIGFDDFKNSLYNEIFNIHNYLSIHNSHQQFNKEINININITENKDDKSNYDYYMDKLKKNCSYF